MKNSKRKVIENKVELSAGWLSPSGEYFRLEGHYLCHEDLAQELLRSRKFKKKYYYDLAMTVLLDRKWAIIRDKSFYCPKMSYYVGWGLTVEQKHFLKPYIEDGEIIEADIY